MRADRKFERFEDVTPAILQKDKIKLLLCDLDNTLTERLSRIPPAKLEDWIKACQGAGVEIVVISNNVFKKRVQGFCEPYGIRCVWGAKKPLSVYLTQVREEAGVAPENTAMLGNKWSTDMLAAKFAGIKAWKVEARTSLDLDKDS